MELERASSYPVLLPDPTSTWETYNVFNPAVIYHDDLFHMFYRAQGLDWISRIGYAVSRDGLSWNRLRLPVLEPYDQSDARGVEDPRVVEIDGYFYMAYTAFGSESAPGDPTYLGGTVTPMIARSKNLIHWDRIGPVVVGEDNKDHVLFPRKIGGRYALLHRRRPDVWIAWSDDLVTWPKGEMAPIYEPRPEPGWDSLSVGSNGPPIETRHGWLLINHGYDNTRVYRFGAILLDLEEPTRVIHRAETPIFWPMELWELRGDVPNVVFSCANPVVGDRVYVFYGGGDHAIGLATCSLEDLLDYARFG
jgi:predicted GH43/DUF377 family glycosyl hydrolase